MIKVITYGTYDLFHQGHYNLLKRAKALGDYLIVAVTSDSFDKNRGKLNVHDSLVTRIKNVEATGLADEIIVEEYFGQKIDDIKRYNIDIFTVGSDWIGHFDYLNEYCKVVYLDRTIGVSSTELRNKNSINLGVIGAEKIVFRFYNELKFVSGVNLVGIYDTDEKKRYLLSKKLNIKVYNNLNDLYSEVDAVYISLPPKKHYKYIKDALNNDKHVLCEFPFCLKIELAKELFDIAEKKQIVLMEALKTAYCPAFLKLISMAKSGVIGNILNVDANFTQIHGEAIDRQIEIASGGSVNALSSYPLLAIFKLLGTNYKTIRYITKMNHIDVDIFTQIEILFEHSCGNAKVAIDAKSEGDLVITGSDGYIYVPAPWWKTNYFEVRYEDINRNSKYFYRFDGEGLRYEIVNFIDCINKGYHSIALTKEEILAIVSVIENFNDKNNVIRI